MIGYGEDSLTLWALKNRLADILDDDDDTSLEECKIFYRPSFGRRNGIGEFDFIIVSNIKIYLGESKWLAKDIVNDRYIRVSRHRKFNKEIKKPIRKTNSRFTENINIFCEIFNNKKHEIVNVLTFFYHNDSKSKLREKILSEKTTYFKNKKKGKDKILLKSFKFVPIDYSGIEIKNSNYISLPL